MPATLVNNSREMKLETGNKIKSNLASLSAHVASLARRGPRAEAAHPAPQTRIPGGKRQLGHPGTRQWAEGPPETTRFKMAAWGGGGRVQRCCACACAHPESPAPSPHQIPIKQPLPAPGRRACVQSRLAPVDSLIRR